MNPELQAETDQARVEAARAQEKIHAHMAGREHFLLEAGAGSGKTYSLIEALSEVLSQPGTYLTRSHQRVACLTYTNAAKSEILERTDANPRIFCDTLHGFLWSLIERFQKPMREIVLTLEPWIKLLEEHEDPVPLGVTYELGIRRITPTALALHHDDVPVVAIELFSNEKFRSIVFDAFPIFLIDEYQDTPAGLIDAFLGRSESEYSATVGLFGDSWQRIYDNSSGISDDAKLAVIEKHSNFRSDTEVVGFLNRLRSELQQATRCGVAAGSVSIYHSNEWNGERGTHSHKGDLPAPTARAALKWALGDSRENRWIDATNETKVLMLTHAAISREQGYPGIPEVFDFNESFAKKEDDLVAYLVDRVDPALEAFEGNRFGEMLELLHTKRPTISNAGAKHAWSELFRELVGIRRDGTVGAMFDALIDQTLFAVPDVLTGRHADLRDALVLREEDGTQLTRRQRELDDFRDIDFAEVTALRQYLDEKTPFSTKHNVKGTEFDNVVVALGRGWTKYDFAKMLGRLPVAETLNEKDRKGFETSRNLFYVSCSRARHNLSLVFTQQLPEDAVSTLERLLDGELIAIPFGSDGLTDP